MTNSLFCVHEWIIYRSYTNVGPVETGAEYGPAKRPEPIDTNLWQYQLCYYTALTASREQGASP